MLLWLQNEVGGMPRELIEPRGRKQRRAQGTAGDAGMGQRPLRRATQGVGGLAALSLSSMWGTAETVSVGTQPSS